uniref:Ovule protein n=1 Tax=Gongylonema pulchrum TaxID=637853 RepID=A0A183ENG8_9BILA
LLIDFSKCELSGRDCKRLRNLIIQYSDIFSKNKYDLSSCSAVRHDIETTTETLVTMRQPRCCQGITHELVSKCSICFEGWRFRNMYALSKT